MDCNYIRDHNTRFQNGKWFCNMDCNYIRDHNTRFQNGKWFCNMDCNYIRDHNTRFQNGKWFCNMDCNYIRDHNTRFQNGKWFCNRDCNYIRDHNTRFQNGKWFCNRDCNYIRDHNTRFQNGKWFCNRDCNYIRDHNTRFHNKKKPHGNCHVFMFSKCDSKKNMQIGKTCIQSCTSALMKCMGLIIHIYHCCGNIMFVNCHPALLCAFQFFCYRYGIIFEFIYTLLSECSYYWKWMTCLFTYLWYFILTPLWTTVASHHDCVNIHFYCHWKYIYPLFNQHLLPLKIESQTHR